MERSQTGEDRPSEPGREPPFGAVSGGVDPDLLLEASKECKRQISFRLGAGKEERERTNSRSELSHLPVEPVGDTGKKRPSTDENDVGQQGGTDVEVARHDGLGGEFRDGDDCAEVIRVRRRGRGAEGFGNSLGLEKRLLRPLVSGRWSKKEGRRQETGSRLTRLIKFGLNSDSHMWNRSWPYWALYPSGNSNGRVGR